MTKKINQKQALLAIANLERFEASALSAIEVTNRRPPYGRLDDVEAFYEDTHNCGGPVYIVYSYGTPIAWHVGPRNEWVVPNQKYSVTTSKHQSIVRSAIALSKFGKEVAA